MTHRGAALALVLASRVLLAAPSDAQRPRPGPPRPPSGPTRSATPSPPAPPPGQARRAASARVDVLRAADAIPADIVGEFREPVSFAQSDAGQYFVFDRRGHAVYAIDRDRTAAWKLVGIGQEPGRIYEPASFAADPILGTFVVVDRIEGRLRVQRFERGGTRIGGFYLQPSSHAALVIDGNSIGPTGAIAYTGHSLLVNEPESGVLVTEHGMAGEILRRVGALRATGHESDREVHLALNSGAPLAAPSGGYFFVFQTGVPAFRKYDAAGRLEFERHIEGPELDPLIQALPTRWNRNPTEQGTERPVVRALVRAAAVDPAGNLWVALAVPVTYVYNAQGERIRVVQFRAAGLVSPVSLFFASGGRLLVAPGCAEFRP